MHGGSGVEEMLEVVEEDQQLPCAEKADEVVERPDRLRDLGGHELRVREPGERHPEDAVVQRAGELGRDLQCESGLARAARPGHGDEPRAAREQRDELLQLVLSPDERARGDGQIGRVERSKRRELGVTELIEALGLGQILQPVRAQFADRCLAVEEAPGRLGEHDLSPVRGSRDPRRAVDVEAHIALVGQDRLAGVDPHPHTDRAARERVARLNSCCDGIGSAREGEEERVALGVDLDA